MITLRGEIAYILYTDSYVTTEKKEQSQYPRFNDRQRTKEEDIVSYHKTVETLTLLVPKTFHASTPSAKPLGIVTRY